MFGEGVKYLTGKVKHKFRNGHLEYDIYGRVERILISLVYWSAEEYLCRQEMEIANRRNSGYTDAEKLEVFHAHQKANNSVHGLMDDMEFYGVPNWVGNAALFWHRNHDLKFESINDFWSDKNIYFVS